MRRKFRFMVERLYLRLLSLYPYRFRASFGEEIQDIFTRIADEAEEAGNFELLTLYFNELRSLTVSIIREHWNEWRSGMEKKMASENDLQGVHTLQHGVASLGILKSPERRWIFRWTALMTAAILAGWLLMAPIAALLLFVAKLGANVGIFPGINEETLQPAGFFIGLALAYATSQWVMLRKYLPRSKPWFLATGAGFLVAGLLIMGAVSILNNFQISSAWGMVVYFLLLGVVVGMAQWMVLRKILPNAFWILVIDVLAAGSFLLSGDSITSMIELLIFLMLPGLVTGVGIWMLLRWSQPVMAVKERAMTSAGTERRSKKWLWLLLGSISFIPFFFIFSLVYTTSQLELAKNRGIYATAQEAVIARNSQGWGGAEVVKLSGVHAGPNRGDGLQPHVWFGGCTVYLDRIPAGWDRAHYLAGSFYIHVRDGWVYVPEGAFPEFIGSVMELYNLESVNEWKGENK